MELETYHYVGITAGFISILAGILQLVVSFVARRKQKGRGANLMLLGTILEILTKTVVVLVGNFHNQLDIAMEEAPIVMNLLGIVGTIFFALFLVGVFLLVKESQRSDTPARHLIDQ